MHRLHASALGCALAMLGSACGAGSGMSRQQQLTELNAAMDREVTDLEQSYEHSRLVEAVVEEGTLERMTRPEVQEAIGRGDPCSRHPRCAEAGFEDDDWFYHVGQMGGVRAPILIVGFDREGRVGRTWYLRTH